jgi:hypothetical protein
MINKRLKHLLSMKRLSGWQDVKKQHLFFLVLCTFFNEHEVWNKHGFLNLNNLSSVQQKHSKSKIYVHCYIQLKLFGKQQRVDLLPSTQSRKYEHMNK